MRKSLYAALAAAAMLSSFAVDASALPLLRKSQDEITSVTPVRDGCGWRRHWSYRLRRCVWNG